jgi:hypothetical protein
LFTFLTYEQIERNLGNNLEKNWATSSNYFYDGWRFLIAAGNKRLPKTASPLVFLPDGIRFALVCIQQEQS